MDMLLKKTTVPQKKESTRAVKYGARAFFKPSFSCL